MPRNSQIILIFFTLYLYLHIKRYRSVSRLLYFRLILFNCSFPLIHTLIRSRISGGVQGGTSSEGKVPDPTCKITVMGATFLKGCSRVSICHSSTPNDHASDFSEYFFSRIACVSWIKQKWDWWSPHRYCRRWKRREEKRRKTEKRQRMKDRRKRKKRKRVF